MQKLICLKYTDAYYLYDTVPPLDIKLPIYEAYGYIEHVRDHIILHFIRESDPDEQYTLSAHLVHKGLLIPNSAIIEKNVASNDVLSKDLILNSEVEILWNDIVKLANSFQDSPSIMRTSGKIATYSKEFIVLENPITVRVYPLPEVKHPEQDPKFYIIPLSVITDLKNV